MLNTGKYIITQDIGASGIFKFTTTQTFGVTKLKETKYRAQIPPNAYIIQISQLKVSQVIDFPIQGPFCGHSDYLFLMEA